MSAERAGPLGLLPSIPQAVQAIDALFGSTPAVESELGVDETLDLLSNQRRRCIVDAVATADEPVELGDLAEWVASVEVDKPLSEVTEDERKRVYVGIYQCHLDLLEDADVVERERDSGPVAPGPEIDAAKRAVDCVRDAIGGGRDGC